MEQTVKQTVKKATLRPRCIIERPRLIRALDASRSRLRMLIAPAGYGKTTLADQWTSMPERTAVWYPCRRSSADVAVLSVGIAEAASALLPGCVKRVRDRLHASRNPAEEIEVFADILAEDLAAWPSHAWLVIDDYHLAARLADAERFVELLVAKAPANVLLVSRQRPTWVSGRDILYGDVLELNQTELAMIHEEAAQLLSGDHAALTSGLVALANGWPAVVALASASQGVSPRSGDAMWLEQPPEALYDFFAEEVLNELHPEMQRNLSKLSLAPFLTPQLAAELIGTDVTTLVRLLDQYGLITWKGQHLDVHPLTREFIELHPELLSSAERTGVLNACLAHYRKARNWDAATELIEAYGLAEERQAVLEEGLDDLLSQGRLATIAATVDGGRNLPNYPVLDIARSELRLREGKYLLAQSLAERVLQHGEERWKFRALRLAGQAAHCANRESLALALFRRAQDAARDQREARQAQWDQLMCMVALELEGARPLLDELASSLAADDPNDLVRYAGRRLGFGLRFGAIDSLSGAREAAQLLEQVDSPLLRCSFRSTYATALVLAADYEDALRAAEELILDAHEHQLSLVLPYGHAARALALGGLRRFPEALESVREATVASTECSDRYGERNAYAAHVRLLVQETRFAEAVAIEPPSLEDAEPSIAGEVLAARGLAFACLGYREKAEALASEARVATKGLEATTLAAAIDCVLAVEGGRGHVLASAEILVDLAFRAGSVDILVTAYRASPAVLALLLQSPSTREQTLFAVARSGDKALAESVAKPATQLLDPLDLLSPREREVYDLVCEGVANRDIAKLLFISEATVKLHVHHIFNKLGVRNRHALALLAARGRRHQATSEDNTGNASSSS